MNLVKSPYKYGDEVWALQVAEDSLQVRLCRWDSNDEERLYSPDFDVFLEIPFTRRTLVCRFCDIYPTKAEALAAFRKWLE